jgi:hypothetical protein
MIWAASAVDNGAEIGHYALPGPRSRRGGRARLLRHTRGMKEATEIRRSPHRRVVGALVIGVSALVCVVLGVRFAANQIAPSCEWSDDERAAVEAAPVSAFAGANVEPRTAWCDMSMPSELYVSYELPDGAALPADWYERDAVGTWRVAQRFEALPGEFSGLVCYLSSDPEFSGVEVAVRGSGLIVASMSTRGVCDYREREDQP